MIGRLGLYIWLAAGISLQGLPLASCCCSNQPGPRAEEFSPNLLDKGTGKPAGVEAQESRGCPNCRAQKAPKSEPHSNSVSWSHRCQCDKSVKPLIGALRSNEHLSLVTGYFDGKSIPVALVPVISGRPPVQQGSAPSSSLQTLLCRWVI